MEELTASAVQALSDTSITVTHLLLSSSSFFFFFFSLAVTHSSFKSQYHDTIYPIIVEKRTSRTNFFLPNLIKREALRLMLPSKHRLERQLKVPRLFFSSRNFFSPFLQDSITFLSLSLSSFKILEKEFNKKSNFVPCQKMKLSDSA